MIEKTEIKSKKLKPQPKKKCFFNLKNQIFILKKLWERAPIKKKQKKTIL